MAGEYWKVQKSNPPRVIGTALVYELFVQSRQRDINGQPVLVDEGMREITIPIIEQEIADAIRARNQAEAHRVSLLELRARLEALG